MAAISKIKGRSRKDIVVKQLLRYRTVAAIGAFLCLILAATIHVIDILNSYGQKEEDDSQTGVWQYVPSWIYTKPESSKNLQKKLTLPGYIRHIFDLLLHFITKKSLTLARYIDNLYISIILSVQEIYVSNTLAFILCIFVTIFSVFLGIVFTLFWLFGKINNQCRNLTITPVAVRRRGYFNQEEHAHNKSLCLRKMCLFLLLLGILISIPWEFIRLYQNEVAKKAAVTSGGMPPECSPSQMSMWQSIKSWLLWQMSWDHTPCEKYHYALLVDPLWEVTPMMVISSVITRCFTTPIEMSSSTIGRSFRLLFLEIPSQWQPVIMVVLVATALFMMVMLCSYRVAIPLFFKIEPSRKTPIVIQGCGKYNTRSSCVAQNYRISNSLESDKTLAKYQSPESKHHWWDGSFNEH